MNDIQILKNARDLISEPARWTKEAFARNVKGEPCAVSSPDATCFCFWGAVNKFGYLSGEARRVCFRLTPGNSPMLFNDDPKTTHAQVIEMMDKAIKKLENFQ